MKPIATTTSLVQNGHSRIPGRKKIKKRRKRTWSILAWLHWISQKHLVRNLSQSLGHGNYSYFAIFHLAFFFSPSSQTHADFYFTYHIYSHPPEQNQNNWFSVSESLCSTITESRQQPVIRLGPFIPVFKQKLDMIMKGILWHHFLFTAGDSTLWSHSTQSCSL